ncbi:hypothetical protein DL96DRAFT_1675460 [Flagelloscypha sp. PMI_526]|nr:hypothetical protein DL96DRAFT_1675460 [Flagelloscypha sp. PMI_526]
METPISVCDTLEDSQLSAIHSYTRTVPYPCETVEEMHKQLGKIVGKIFVCVASKNWPLLTTWDGSLQCWIELKYPIPKSTRVKLVKMYYELALLPGLEARLTRSWADMLSRLLSNKPGLRRKLEATDLHLPWQPLWNVLKKEILPKKRLAETNRNVVNILLYVAEQCQRYFGPDSIQPMLDEFLPILTKDTVLLVIPILTSFLPPTQTHLYIPVLMRLWEAFNSSIIDDRLLDFLGQIVEEHVAGKAGLVAPEGGAEWKDVGIWSSSEWNFIIGKGFNAMSVPIGSTRFSSATAGSADQLSDRNALRLKKSMNRFHSLAKIIVYSISLDAPVRQDTEQKDSTKPGSIAGSQALDTLEKLITSTESFFHPSNSGHWSLGLCTFLHRLASEYAKRVKEEEEPDCKTPKERRLTPAMTSAFVTTLRTPALFSMFAKDAVCMSYAQGALRVMSILRPKIIMPDLMEKAYGGLEVVNETHRTTAVLSTLSGVALPLVSERIWLGGQKHIVPLLELSLPGIDVNDPIKTICTTMFIVAVVQHIKLGDLSSLPSMAMSEELLGHDDLESEDEPPHFPIGSEAFPVLSRDEERSLARDNTASFADWVTSLFRRVLALYENLPEEGGKKNITGGKSEESVLKSIKSMMDVVCLHLSDELFDLVLRLCFDYATTNAKSNAVRAFGHLIACLARVQPEKVLAKFLPHCLEQIEEEIKHGASSTRTTSSHAAAPSDTTLHWNISILRGCLGYGGSVLLKYKTQILSLLTLLIKNTKSERGYSTTGHLLTRVLHTIAGTYPLNSRFVNTDKWEEEEFNANHNLYWGRMYKPEEVTIDWHTTTSEEIDFVMEIGSQVIGPCMITLDRLLTDTSTWKTEERNDFCRFLNAVKSFWSGLPTFLLEQEKAVDNPCINEEYEFADMIVEPLRVSAGFALRPQDSRYTKFASARQSFLELLARAAASFRDNVGGEDHTDAVVAVTRAIDVALLEYGMTRGSYDALRKNFKQARDVNKLWSRQQENSRLVQVKRAQLYHSSRLYMHALYRRRDAMDDKLIYALVDLSLSHYVRVRRQAQAVFQSVASYYIRSTRLALPILFGALAKGNEPDRMKGALYILRNKGTAAYALSELSSQGEYLTTLLECQHEEKPSIQKLVTDIARECTAHLVEESVHTEAYQLPIDRVEEALNVLKTDFPSDCIDSSLVSLAEGKAPARAALKEKYHNTTVTSILAIASRAQTHWRYVEMALRFIVNLLRRDAPADVATATFLIKNTTSPQMSIRVKSQRGLEKLLAMIKARTYSKTPSELWLEQWNPPLGVAIELRDSVPLLAWSSGTAPQEIPFIDKITTGFLTWESTSRAYHPPTADFVVQWEDASQPALKAISKAVCSEEYFDKLFLLWGQESTKTSGTLELRADNYTYIKSLAKMFPAGILDVLLTKIEPYVFESDKYKQRAGAEALSGLLRGAKHWQTGLSERLWEWTFLRLDAILAQIKPEVLYIWEGAFSYVMHSRDPRRVRPLIDWILSLPLDFHGDSAFAMTKMIALCGIMIGNLNGRFESMSDKYFSLLLDNANTPYFEIRAQIANILYYLVREWHPRYHNTRDLLLACTKDQDPLFIRQTRHLDKFKQALSKLPELREERLPPPRVSQSEYDKIGLSLLQFLWASAHGSHAIKIFPYIVPMMPEILRMAELNDSQDLQTFSMGVLHVLSAVTPPQEIIETVIENFVNAIQSSTSWRTRRHALPALVIFFYRNLTVVPPESIHKIMTVLKACLRDENVEVREMASTMLSGLIRCSQRQSIKPLKSQFLAIVGRPLPSRRDDGYQDALRTLHSGILGLCALIQSFPYSVEPWMPPLTEVLAPHATDPPPISTTIRKVASDFKKTHQDTWHKDQLAFDEDQLQSLSTMLVGTSYYCPPNLDTII